MAAPPGHNKQPANFPDMIKQMEEKIASMGPGPHTDKQKEELMNLQTLLSKVKQEHAKTANKDSKVGIVTSSAPSTTLSGGQGSFVTHTSHSTYSGSGVASTTSNDFTRPGSLGGSHSDGKVLDRSRLSDLANEVDPMEQFEDESEETILQFVDDFIEKVIGGSCDLAKHRAAENLECKDVQLYLSNSCHMWMPGFSNEEPRPYKKAPATEAHKQRLALIRKSLKKC